MANQSNQGGPGKPGDKGGQQPETPEELYTPERIDKWIRGEISMAELDGFTAADIQQFAEIGFAQYESGKLEEARVIFTGLIALEPKEPYFRTALGCVFMGQEKYDRAADLFTEAIGFDKEYQPAYVNRGEVYLRLGKIVEAADDFKKALALDPENKSPFSARARALANAALETLEEIVRASGMNPDEPVQTKPKPVTSGKPGPAAKVPSKPKKK